MAPEIYKSNEEIWNRRLLKRELKSLEREKHHLSSKSHERPLNSWESRRMSEILVEVMQLLKMFGSPEAHNIN